MHVSLGFENLAHAERGIRLPVGRGDLVEMPDCAPHADPDAHPHFFEQGAGEKGGKIRRGLILGIFPHKLDKSAVFAGDDGGAVVLPRRVLGKERDHFRRARIEGDGQRETGQIGQGIFDAERLDIGAAAFSQKDAAHKLPFRDIQRLARVIFDDFGKKGRIIFFHRARAADGADEILPPESDLEQGTAASFVLQNALKRAGRNFQRTARRGKQEFSLRRKEKNLYARAFRYRLQCLFQFGIHILLPLQ